jgi:hypothetical protein
VPLLRHPFNAWRIALPISLLLDRTTSRSRTVPLGKVAHILSIRRYISKYIIERIAIEKYQKNGLGITFGDIETEMSLNKAKAQRTLKVFSR